MERHALVLAAAACVLIPAGAEGQMTTTRLTPTSAAATAPAPPEPVDPAAMEILRRLEQAGEKYPNIVADLKYRELLRQYGDVEDRTGKVYFQAARGDAPAKFRVHFDYLRQGNGPRTRYPEDYVFDGQWFTIRKQRVKQHSVYQVVGPDEKIEPLELGKGRFPIPFGQKVKTVLEHFEVSTRPPKEADPPGCDYLKLVARPQHTDKLDVTWLEMWVRRKTGLPVKMVGEDVARNRKTAVFEKISMPKSLPKETFVLPKPPAGQGWHYEVKLLEPRDG